MTAQRQIATAQTYIDVGKSAFTAAGLLPLVHCATCATTYNTATVVTKVLAIATVGAVLIPFGIGEVAGAIQACNPGLNTSNYGHITVYCRAWMAGNLIEIGYDPKNGLHVNIGNTIHVPLWPKP